MSISIGLYISIYHVYKTSKRFFPGYEKTTWISPVPPPTGTLSNRIKIFPSLPSLFFWVLGFILFRAPSGRLGALIGGAIFQSFC